MKNSAKLNGAKALSKMEQKSINGGGGNRCVLNWECGTNMRCCFGTCKSITDACTGLDNPFIIVTK